MKGYSKITNLHHATGGIASILVIVPVTLYCAAHFSKETKARRVRQNTNLIKRGMNSRQILEILDSPDYADHCYSKKITPLDQNDCNTVLWSYHWGFGTSYDMDILMKHDSVIAVYQGG